MLAAAVQSNAQEKWNLTIRPGVNFPVKKLASADLNTGFGFDALIGYRVMPHLLVNTGWGWNRFSADNSTMDFEETGYLFGLQFAHPIKGSTLQYRVGANALYKHIEVENADGDLVFNTGHGWGWQADAGLAIPLSKKLYLVPAIRYHSLSRDLKLGATEVPADLRYLAVDVGFSWNF